MLRNFFTEVCCKGLTRTRFGGLGTVSNLVELAGLYVLPTLTMKLLINVLKLLFEVIIKPNNLLL